jgi:hypothetical protein
MQVRYKPLMKSPDKIKSIAFFKGYTIANSIELSSFQANDYSRRKARALYLQ